MQNGSIIVIDDDLDDHEILSSVIESLDIKNEVIFFTEGAKALNYLSQTSTKIFFILCDINMPTMDGLKLREKIMADGELKNKSIPFVFFTTGTSKQSLDRAYDLTVQGFFLKPVSLQDLACKIKLIVDYWNHCIHPNSF